MKTLIFFIIKTLHFESSKIFSASATFVIYCYYPASLLDTQKVFYWH